VTCHAFSLTGRLAIWYCVAKHNSGVSIVLDDDGIILCNYPRDVENLGLLSSKWKQIQRLSFGSSLPYPSFHVKEST
jgi:hypothetical protein